MKSGAIKIVYLMIVAVPLYGCSDFICRATPGRSEDSCRPKEEDEPYTPPAPGQFIVNCRSEDLDSKPDYSLGIALTIVFEPEEHRRFGCYVTDDSVRMELKVEDENFADQKCTLSNLSSPLSGSAIVWYNQDIEKGFYENYEGEDLKGSGVMECSILDTR